MRKIPAVSEGFWPEEDARTLAHAHEILADKKRTKAAAVAAAKIATKKEKQTKHLKHVAKKAPASKPKMRKKSR